MHCNLAWQHKIIPNVIIADIWSLFLGYQTKETRGDCVTASILVFDTNLDTMEWKLDPFDKIMFSACNKGDNDQIANGKKDHNIFNF